MMMMMLWMRWHTTGFLEYEWLYLSTVNRAHIQVNTRIITKYSSESHPNLALHRGARTRNDAGLSLILQGC